MDQSVSESAFVFVCLGFYIFSFDVRSPFRVKLQFISLNTFENDDAKIFWRWDSAERFTFVAWKLSDWVFDIQSLSDKNIRKQKKTRNALTVTEYRAQKTLDRMSNPLDKIQWSDIYVRLSKYKNMFGKSNSSEVRKSILLFT